MYVSILAIIYTAFISIGKRSFKADEIAYRVMLLIIAIELLVMWMFSTSYIKMTPHLMRVNSPFIFLFAPSFFFYVFTRLYGIEKFRTYDALHLAPAILIFASLIPFYVLSAEGKLDLYAKWLNGSRVDSFPTELIYSIQQHIYAMAIVTALVLKWKKADKLVVFMAASFILIWGISFIRNFLEIGNSSMFVWLYFISFLPLLILFELGFQHDRRKKYATSGIQGSKIEAIALQANDLIIREELFKNPRLILNDVANKLGVHHNYVSQAINSLYGRKFKDIVNSMRVKEAKKLLADESLNHLTLEAIAEMAGFNSVSNFNASFKKNARETPSEFKKRIQS